MLECACIRYEGIRACCVGLYVYVFFFLNVCYSIVWIWAVVLSLSVLWLAGAAVDGYVAGVEAAAN